MVWNKSTAECAFFALDCEIQFRNISAQEELGESGCLLVVVVAVLWRRGTSDEAVYGNNTSKV